MNFPLMTCVQHAHTTTCQLDPGLGILVIVLFVFGVVSSLVFWVKTIT